MNKKLNEKRFEEPYLSAAITNLGKYNEGILKYVWVDFPIDEDEFQEKLKEIGVSDESDYEEYFISDYDCNVPGLGYDLGEYVDFDYLNDLAEKIKKVDATALGNVLEVVSNVDEAIDGLISGDINFYPDVKEASDVASLIIDDMYGGLEHYGNPSIIEDYFDYEALGRELDMDSYKVEDDDGNYIWVSAGEYFCGDPDASHYHIGECFVDQVGFEGVEHPEYYFDYDSYGKNELLEGSFTLTEDGAVEVL